MTVAFTLSAEMGDPMGRNPIGLKPVDFFKALEKGASVGAIVSLAGAPFLNAQAKAQLSPIHPPALVVATSSLGNVLGVPGDRLSLSGLLDTKVIQLAIVDGESGPNEQSAGKTDATHRLFIQHYTILRSHD